MKTKEEIIAALDDLTSGDPEGSHAEAEKLLCEFLRDAGHPEIADAFERAKSEVGFWYA